LQACVEKVVIVCKLVCGHVKAGTFVQQTAHGGLHIGDLEVNRMNNIDLRI
jgi:hypothetical protein